jgi:hypothetical protein
MREIRDKEWEIEREREGTSMRREGVLIFLSTKDDLLLSGGREG